MRVLIVLLSFALTGANSLFAWQGGNSYQWRYYRASNTGIQGDYCEALLISDNGNPWIAGYDPSFEEGGLTRFLVSANRWENLSNVDHPTIGHPDLTGVTRISDIAQDEFGNLWMSTGRGALFYSPAIGPASLIRFGEDNSPIRGGWNRGVELAPDGTVWFSAYSTVWGQGGISQFDPSTGQWRTFDNWFGDGQLAIQPRTNGEYYVWINTYLENSRMARYDSETDTWEDISNQPGNPAFLMGKNVTDPQGNSWLFKWVDPQLFEIQLDCRRPDGTWFNLPAPPFGTNVAELRAKSSTHVLVVDGGGGCWRFNGSAWAFLGTWLNTFYSYDIDEDANGNLWVCGIGGASRKDALTGQWQRYRITNTSQYDFFNVDLSVNATGIMYATANAGPGVGGMVKFDGVRWTGFNNHHYGLGFDWPFNTDNSQKVYYRNLYNEVLVNPTYGGLQRLKGNTWTNTNFPYESPGDMRDDGRKRLWATHPGQLLIWRNNSWRQVNDIGGTKLRPDPTNLNKIWVMGDVTFHSTDSINSQVWGIEDFPELSTQSDQFKGLAVAPNGTVWIGANTINLPDNSTVLKLNPTTGQYVAYRYGQNWPFPGQYVMPLAVTPDGKMWFQYDSDFGIDEQGLGCFDGTAVQTFPAPFEGRMQWGGLPHAGIVDLEVRRIRNGYELWMCCASRGIAVLKVNQR